MKKRGKIVIFLCAAGIILLHCMRISNVFDAIYYTRIYTNYFTGTSLGNMPQLEGVDRGTEEMFRSEGYFVGAYREEYLEDREICKIFIGKEDKILQIIYRYRENDVMEEYWYTYDVKSKTLTHQAFRYETRTAAPRMIQKENEERKQYFYDGFLKDWFAANRFSTRFSSKHLGMYHYEEEFFNVKDVEKVMNSL